MEHVCMHVATCSDHRAQFICVRTVFLQVFTRQFHALVALGVTDQPLEVHKIVYHSVANVVYIYIYIYIYILYHIPCVMFFMIEC